MSDLFKEMCSLSGKLNDLIDKTEDKEERKTLLTIFFKINEQCKKIAHQEFDENDDFYCYTVDSIINTEWLIKEFKENQIKLINVFVHIIDVIANIEKIILGWKIGNRN